MEPIEDEIKIIAREEYKEEFEKIEKEKLALQLENGELKNENGKYKKGIDQLNKMKDLTPEARKIINSLIIH